MRTALAILAALFVLAACSGEDAAAARKKKIDGYKAQLKVLNGQLAEKQKALKGINVALADTPENVVKKLKGLKKEKLDEANARKRVENDLRSARKDKQNLEKRLSEAKETSEKGVTLVEQYRELRTLCEAQQKQLAECLKDGESLPELPVIDEELLEAVGKADNSEKEEGEKKKRKRA